MQNIYNAYQFCIFCMRWVKGLKRKRHSDINGLLCNHDENVTWFEWFYSDMRPYVNICGSSASSCPNYSMNL